jgi:hypothetical protein
MAVNNKELLHAALEYAAIGLPIVPLYGITNGHCECGNLTPHHFGKHPRIAGGVNGASLDPVQIRSWWQRWPDANIGGAIPQGVHVLEIDSLTGIEDLATAGVEIPPHAPRVRTGRNGVGLHVWFTSKLRLPNRADGQVVCDVGFRGHGEYVVLPPSLHVSGRHYHWEVPVAHPFPNCLPAVSPQLTALVLKARRAGEWSARDRRWKASFTPVSPGQQAITLISLAGRLARALPDNGWDIIPLALQKAASHYALGDAAWPWVDADFHRIARQVCEKEQARRRREGDGHV